ncbi:hypothetical protein [Magnetospira sp. QH-2]|uniref:hypothetical protein n=1 Tax=Magnetospira sp. (strain QH-2) TaxID=1288970 RepID=UPI0003E8143A|nr:hypothetical protein [Magnetospira sp. QH-2]CCQ74851.1 exported protein of unknown function [Magnetospira sp. QH-2]
MLLRLLLLAGVLLFALPAQAVSMGGMTMPMHGNWCGPGHPKNALRASLPPIDALDDACRRHDYCYIQQGEMDCGCDIAFMNELRNMRYPFNDQRIKARAMYDAIAMMPCDNPMGMAYKQSCVWGDLMKDMMTGRAGPWEMPLRWMYLGDKTMDNKDWLDRWGW